MPLKTNGLWSRPLNGRVSSSSTSIGAQKASLSETPLLKCRSLHHYQTECQSPAGSGGVPDLASSRWIHGTCQSSPIQLHSQPSNLASPGLLLPSQDLAGPAPSLCKFTITPSISWFFHWLTSLSLQILQHHETHHPFQDTSENAREQYTDTTLGQQT